MIKVQPNASFIINKNCELIVNMCHNVKEVSRPIKGITNISHGSMNIYSFNGTSENCSAMKKFIDQELVRTIWTINGIRLCEDFMKGIRCYNGTIFKYKKFRRAISLMTMTAKQGDIFRVYDKVTFENGKKSCVDINVVLNKIN
jgi:hypothetical protein